MFRYVSNHPGLTLSPPIAFCHQPINTNLLSQSFHPRAVKIIEHDMQDEINWLHYVILL